MKSIDTNDDVIKKLHEENKQLKEKLRLAVECIYECEEAFSNRCHDDYAEEAIERWMRNK